MLHFATLKHWGNIWGVNVKQIVNNPRDLSPDLRKSEATVSRLRADLAQSKWQLRLATTEVVALLAKLPPDARTFAPTIVDGLESILRALGREEVVQ